MRRLYYYIIGVIALLLTSCEYKELCYDHSHVASMEVQFDWQLSPDASPEGMTVLFYDMSLTGQEPIRYDLAGMMGGTVRLGPGTYRAMAFNNDTETILFRGLSNIETVEAYTRTSSLEEGTQLTTRSSMPMTKGTEDESVILEPDMLWGAVSEPFTVGFDGHVDPIVMMPQARVENVIITLYNVPNLIYSSQFGGSLSGMAPAVNMFTGELMEGHATQAFTINAIDETTLQIVFRTFGHCPHAEDEGITPEQKEELMEDHQLTIYAVLADGTQWYFTTEVTDQMHDPIQIEEEKKTEELIIELDEDIPIPKPIVNGSGFKPEIDDWQSIEIPVGMPDDAL